MTLPKIDEDWGKAQLPSGPSNLCFNKDEFMKGDFNIDRFVSNCRKHVSLETLREDLGLYLRLLRTAMIELINQDYADFVNLSGNLVGLDRAIGNIVVPLGQLQEEVMSVKTSVDETVTQIENKLNRRKYIRDKKTLLQRLKTSVQCIERIETLLKIQSPVTNLEDKHSHLHEAYLDGNLMERVATEFSQLEFVVNKSTDLQLVGNMKPRILQITTILQHNLERTFLSGMKSKDREQLEQCLRIYAAIGKTRDAEELFRKRIVAPYMESILNEKFLNSHVNGLKGMYATVLEFIPKNCLDLRFITNSSLSKETETGFDFLVNAVWPDIVDRIQMNLPMVWDLTNPVAFHEQYLVSMEFLEKFEECCETTSSVSKLRGQKNYATFLNKWNIAVYFQIRFQEIAGRLESCLSNTDVNEASVDFFLPQTCVLWECLHTCWLPDTLLRPLTYRFWKLNLLLLSRYTKWISDSMCDLPDLSKDINGGQVMTNLVDGTKATTVNGVTEKSQPENHSVITLHRIAALTNDIDRLLLNIPVFVKDIVEPHVQDIDVTKKNLLNESVEEIHVELSSVLPRLGQIVVHAVSAQCCGNLKLVYDIPRLFRKTNREVPNKPSLYVSTTLKPVQSFLNDHEFLSTYRKNEWSAAIVENITVEYLKVTNDVLTSVKKMEDSLKRLKKARDKTATSSIGGAGGMSDDDKIRLQLVLDVEFYKKMVESVGVDIANCSSLQTLEELVVSARASPGPAS